MQGQLVPDDPGIARQLAIVSLRHFGADALNEPIRFRKGYEADGVSLLLTRPVRKIKRLPAVLNRVIQQVDLNEPGKFADAVKSAKSELLSSEVMEVLWDTHRDFDPFAYSDAIDAVIDHNDPDAAYDLSTWLEPLKGKELPVAVRYARSWSGLRPQGIHENLERGTQSFSDERLKGPSLKIGQLPDRRDTDSGSTVDGFEIQSVFQQLPDDHSRALNSSTLSMRHFDTELSGLGKNLSDAGND